MTLTWLGQIKKLCNLLWKDALVRVQWKQSNKKGTKFFKDYQYIIGHELFLVGFVF